MATLFVNLAWVLVLPQAGSSRGSSSRLAVVTPSDGEVQEHDAESLLQANVVKTDHNGPNGPGWFGDFSEGESTFTYDGTRGHRDENTQVNTMDGWNPQQKNPFFTRATPMQWFEESKSGGPKQAWQSDYPVVKTGVAGNRANTGAWFTGEGGVWQQEYVKSARLSTQNVPASWFDDSVNQYDGFGRPEFPALDSELGGSSNPRNFLDWQERSVNTSLSCQKPGCTANVSLLAPFDFNTEIFKNCRLNVYFHPTDFDDQFAGENVEWVQVNNHAVAAKCHPYGDGCNATAQRPLLTCMDDVPIDLLMPKNGELKIAAKIPENVDECPYKGNMLSAVPTVTCLVASKHNPHDAPPRKPVSLTNTNMTCVTKMPLQCATKGCAAEIAIPVNKTCAHLGQCTLSIDVQQTDFDGADGTSEVIEYIKVDGKNVSTNLKPGKNPCKLKWSGTNVTDADKTFSALSNHVVNVSSGKIRVEGKISKFVDECPSDGYLFNAVATVTCKPAAKAVLLSQTKNQRRQLRVKAL